MAMFRGIVKNLGALLTANAVSILTELVLPPLFILRYGNGLYSAWIVMSAAVAYLGNLNFGVQTFVNQDLAVRFGRGERDSFHVQQSTALRLLLGLAVAAAVLCLIVFVLPVEEFLRVPLSHAATAWSLYFIALQIILADILFGFFCGNFMVVGRAHRGANWNSAQRFTSAALLALLAAFRVPLPVLAGAQTALFFGFMAAIIVDLKRSAPEIFPTLRYWDRAAVQPILTKSGYFGLIIWSTFFCYQLPVILMQRSAGPAVVVTFQLMRKIFGLGRQVLNAFTQSMGPEITLAYGRNDWSGLLKLYRSSERLIFALIAGLNLPLLYLAPLLLLLWIHPAAVLGALAGKTAAIHSLEAQHSGYFSLTPYILITAINTALCIKEHKFQFQFSTNTHEKLAKVMFGGYLLMGAVSYFAIQRYGLVGFLSIWLVVELGQTYSIMGMNASLFASIERLSHTLVRRLTAITIIGLAGGDGLLRHTMNSAYPLQIAADMAAVCIVLITAYFAFGIGSLTATFVERLKSRFKAA